MEENHDPTSPESVLAHAQRLQALTQSYARFAQSAGGLAAVLGGLLCLAAYFAGGILPPTQELHLALIATPVLWLIAKQWMASRYYQRYGRVAEVSNDAERRQRALFIGFSGLVALAVAAGFVIEHEPFGRNAWNAQGLGYLLVVAALPLVVWRWLRTPLDFVVGSFLLCQAALASSGQAYPLWSSALVFPLAALLLIITGLQDHRRFLAIDAEIRQLQHSRKADA